jgi:hypothetical protein
MSACWDDASHRHLLAPAEARHTTSGVETQYTNEQSFIAGLPSAGLTTSIDFATRDDGTPLYTDGEHYFSTLSLRGVQFVPVGGTLFAYYNFYLSNYPANGIRANLPPNTYAVGMKLVGAFGNPGNYTCMLSSGTSVTLPLATPFIGFKSTTPISWISCVFDNDLIVIDDFQFSVVQPGSVLPAGPSTALSSTLGVNPLFENRDVPGINRPLGVNDAGLIVGDYGSNNIAGVWSPSTGFSSIGNLGSGSTTCCSTLFAVNNSGQASGASLSADGGVTATTWSAEPNGYHDLGIAGRTYAHSINDAGDIVGTDYSGFATSWYKGHAGDFAWLRRGPFTTQMDANGIGGGGRIVGDVYLTDTDPRPIAWQSYAADPVQLPTIGGDRGVAWAVNAAGDMVGWTDVAPGSTIHHATLWPASGGVVDLNTWANGCSGPSEARAINAQGVIVGRCNGMPVIWTAKEGQRSLPVPPGVQGAEPTSVSDGHAVGIVNGFGSIQWTITPGLSAAPSAALFSTLSPSAIIISSAVPGLNRPLGVNDAGLVVGDYGSNNIAGVWSPTTGFTSIGNLGSGSTVCCSTLLSVNNSGQATGSSLSLDGSGVAATIWSAGPSGYRDLGIPNRPFGHAINDAGDVVGTDYSGDADFAGRPTSWFKSHTGAFNWLPRGSFVTQMDANGINSAGIIAGDVFVADNQPRALAWPSPNRRPVLLTSLGGTNSFAWAANTAGDIVGWSEVSPGSSVRHAALWPASGGVVDLNSWAGGCGSASEARAISATGIIAGRCNGLPVVWTAREGQRSLPVPPGTTGAEPTAISAGHIVGILNGFGSIQWTINAPGATQSGTAVSVQPVDQTTGQPSSIQMTFSNVTTSGLTSISSGTLGQGQLSPPQPPLQFVVGSPATYYDISTTATFANGVTLCINYSGIDYGNTTSLKLLHFNRATQQWDDITTSLNTQTHVVCGTTSSLSPFIVVGSNQPPAVTSIVLPSQPLALGSAASVSARFTDPNPTDTHSSTINWGTSTTAGLVTAEPTATTAGTVTGQFTYGAPGVYTVGVTVSDGTASGSRSSGLDTPSYIVVYDPTGGFVTGGGWILSPANACQIVSLCGSTSEGKATFGFVSKYQKGATVPTGNTQFQYHAGGFVFASTSYDWLVVAGPKAQYKGSGTINGSGDYAFMLTATDGDVQGGGGTDRFRIKIWSKTNGAIVYDNVFGGDDSAAPQAVAGGSIQIQSR